MSMLLVLNKDFPTTLHNLQAKT